MVQRLFLLFFPTALSMSVSFSQQASERLGVPFLLIAPDPRASGLGDVGTASRPDVYAMHWNAAKYAFANESMGLGLTYTPWLRQLANDRYLIYLSGFAQMKNRQTIAGSVKYFSMGEYLLTGEMGENEIPFTPNEWSIDVAYAKMLFDYLSASVSFRLLHSGMSATDFFRGNDNGAYGLASDVSLFYISSLKNADQLCFGLKLANLGPAMSYGSISLPLPSLLRVGGGYNILAEGTRVSLISDISRLLVDLNASKNLYAAGVGIECSFMEKFALRGGYHSESISRYYTVGIGLSLKNITIDLSYLTSPETTNPLQNTLRFGIAYSTDRKLQP